MSERLAPRRPVNSTKLAADERQPPSVRAQSAIVRTLADALEQLPLSADNSDALRAQLAEEVSRLRLRIEEAAAQESQFDKE
jgi:hypothetical protein